MAKGTVAVKFTGDTTSLHRAIDSTDRKMKGLGGKFSQFGGMAAAGLAGVAAGAVVFGKTSVDAFVEAEEAQAGLSAAFEKFPALADGNIDALRDLNSELAKTTKFDDDATASGQAVLAQFGLNADQIAELTPLMQDYAEKTGKDLPTAAQDLGKAVMGQGRALKAVGLDLKDTGTASGNLEQLMGGLNEKVGGFAEVAGGTAAGKAAILKNQFGELQEKVGSALIPALLKIADVFTTSVLPAIEDMVATVQENWPKIQATITDAVEGIRDVVTPIVGALQALWDNFGNNILELVQRVWPRIQQIIEGVLGIIRGIIKTVTSLIRGDWAGVWEGIQQIVAGAWEYIQGITGAALEALRAIVGVVTEIIVSGLKAAWDGVVSFFGRLPGRLAAAGAGMFDWIKEAFRSAINWVIRKWNDFELKVDIPDAIPGLPDEFKVSTPNIPTLHSGGVYRAPGGAREGLALLETGETVTPVGGGGGDVYNINVTAQHEPVALAVVRELKRDKLLMGTA